MVKIWSQNYKPFCKILNIAHFWVIFEVFLVMPPVELDKGSSFCSHIKPSRHWVSGPNLNFLLLAFWGYLNFFFFKDFWDGGAGHSLGQEKQNSHFWRFGWSNFYENWQDTSFWDARHNDGINFFLLHPRLLKPILLAITTVKVGLYQANSGHKETL